MTIKQRNEGKEHVKDHAHILISDNTFIFSWHTLEKKKTHVTDQPHKQSTGQSDLTNNNKKYPKKLKWSNHST